MKIEFLGALNSIGASAIYLKTEESSALLDYGAKTGETPPKPPLSLKEKKVDCIFLTHTHLDHSGFIPLAMKKFDAKLFCLDITLELTKLLLLDSIKISKEEGYDLPFTAKDVENLSKKTVLVDYENEYSFKDIRVKFLNASHVVGSAQILIEHKNKKILYSGDFNTIETNLLKANEVIVEDLNVLITESTYHDREHEDRKKEEKRLVEIVERTIENSGICLIPAFAVNRAQEVFTILVKEKIQCPIYVDGLAKKATIIINKYKKYLKEGDVIEKAIEKIEFVKKEDRKKILKEGSCVIICGNGFLNGGPAEFYFRKIKDHEENSVVFVGYQVEGSNGRKILENKTFEGKKIKVLVEKVDLSSHAGKKELIKFIKENNPEKIFCVHGENLESFVENLKEMGFEAIAPSIQNRVFYE